jgi:hypothetical protein
MAGLNHAKTVFNFVIILFERRKDTGMATLENTRPDSRSSSSTPPLGDQRIPRLLEFVIKPLK